MNIEKAKKNLAVLPHFFSAPARFVALPIILHLLIALPFAYVLNIWMDEASTLYTTRNGFFQTLNNVFADEKQAPLYFLVLSVWRLFDDSIFFARLFSVLSSVLAIFFFYRLADRFFEAFAAKFITVLFAFHPYLIWASVEIRVYSTVILFSVLLLEFFAKGFLDENYIARNDSKARRKARIFYVLIAIVALYTNYYLGFLLVGVFFALLAARRFQAARAYFLQMLIVGACISPLIWIIRQQFALNTDGFVEEKSIAEGLHTLWNHIFALTFPIDPAPQTERSLITVIRIWFIGGAALAVIFYLVKNKFRAVSEKILLLGTTTTVVGICLLGAYFLLGTAYIAFRHAAILFVPLVLFSGLIFTNILPKKILICFIVILTLLFPYSKIYKQFPMAAKRGDWARVARFIEENEKPNQPIIVFRNYDALSLPFYYKGSNRILPDEKFFDWNPEDAASSENAFRSQTAFIISEIPTDAHEIWLATEEICQDAKTGAACLPLENFLEANYTVIETKDFYLEKLRLLRRK